MICGMDLSDAFLCPRSISCWMAVSMPFMVCAGACRRIMRPLLMSSDFSSSTSFIEHQPCRQNAHTQTHKQLPQRCCCHSRWLQLRRTQSLFCILCSMALIEGSICSSAWPVPARPNIYIHMTGTTAYSVEAACLPLTCHQV